MRMETEPNNRRAVNVTLPVGLVEEARALGLNVSRACEEGLAAVVQAAREAQWRAENREALSSWAAWDEANESPLGRFRAF
jgi:antitoxin CcdA